MKHPNDATGNRGANTLPRLAYRVPEAARAVGLSRSSLYLWIKKGAIPVKKCGARTLILHDDLVDFIKSLP
jgi:excisionase family DNA binding protein